MPYVAGTAPDAAERTSGLIAFSSDATFMGWYKGTGAITAGDFPTLFYIGDDPQALYVDYIWLGFNDKATPEISFDITGLASPTLVEVKNGNSQLLHWAYVRSGTSHTLYINGIAILTETIDVSSLPAPTHSYLGTDTYAVDFNEHEFSRYREWDVALTAAEVNAEYLSETVVRSSDLQVDAPFSADFDDDSGNGNDWTNMNSSSSTSSTQPNLPVRLYITRDPGFSGVPWAPATYRGSWDTDPNLDCHLIDYKGGLNNGIKIRTETDTSAHNLGNFRCISEPLEAQTISGEFNLVIAASQTAAAAMMYWRIHVYVMVGNTDVVRGTLIDKYVEGSGIPTGDNIIPTTSAGHSLVQPYTMSSVAASEGDRLVAEIGVRAYNTVATAYTIFNRIGSNDGTTGDPDLVVGSTAVTTSAGYLEFHNGISLLEQTIVAGDLIVGSSDFHIYDKDTGDLKRRIFTPGPWEPTGMAADSNGNIFNAMQQGDVVGVNVFDPQFPVTRHGQIQTLNTWTTTPALVPHSIAIDSDDNIYVGHGGAGTPCGDTFGPAVGSAATRAVKKYNNSGSLLATFAAPAAERSGTPAIALANDDRTLFYTSLGREVKRYDVMTSSQLTDFATLPGAFDVNARMARGIRLLEDGGVLVADFENIKRLDSMGNLVQTYNTPTGNDWGTVALSPDGTEFWAANTAQTAVATPRIAKFNLASGAVLIDKADEEVIDTFGNMCSGGIMVFDEFTIPPPGTPPPSGPPPGEPIPPPGPPDFDDPPGGGQSCPIPGLAAVTPVCAAPVPAPDAS